MARFAIFTLLPVGSPLMQGQGVCSKIAGAVRPAFLFHRSLPRFLVMNPISTPGRFPKLIRRLRPSFAEVEQYARLIIEHERKPITALAACMAEAEIQIWAIRSMLGGDDGHPDGTANA